MRGCVSNHGDRRTRGESPSPDRFAIDLSPQAGRGALRARRRRCPETKKQRGRSRAAGLSDFRQRLLIDLEQARAALAAADAHRDDAPLGLAPAAFLQDVTGEARAGHAEGMADRDRAAIDVVFLRIDAELVARIEALAGEGFIELPEID